MTPQPGWEDAARQGWINLLRAYGLEDGVSRPTELAALRNLKAHALMGARADLPLTPRELDLWLLERQFMQVFETQAFRLHYGVLSAGDKYVWIATQRPGLLAYEVRRTLDEVHAVLDQFALDVAVETILMELLAA